MKLGGLLKISRFWWVRFYFFFWCIFVCVFLFRFQGVEATKIKDCPSRAEKQVLTHFQFPP